VKYRERLERIKGAMKHAREEHDMKGQLADDIEFLIDTLEKMASCVKFSSKTITEFKKRIEKDKTIPVPFVNSQLGGLHLHLEAMTEDM
jgi:hypothetical protein